jgi:membrane protease YdiL (CAAX protease family)
MTTQAIIDIATYVATALLGIYAIVVWWRRKTPVLKGLGLAVDGHSPIDFVLGVAIAAAAVTAIFGIELGLHAIRPSPVTPNVGMTALYGAVLLVFAFKEEFLMRSLLLSGLALLLRDRWITAVLVTSVVFGLSHLSEPHATAVSVISNGLGGLTYGLAFVGTRRLWAPLGLHFAWNFVQGPLFGFILTGHALGGLLHIYDLGPAWLTGGAFGPEAGAIGLGMRFVIIAAIGVWTWRAKRKPDTPAMATP